jgi:predicted enzyme related to lactoylglutathione lyase
MINGLRFVWLEVTELERSIRYYRDGLGMRVEAAAPVRGQRVASVEAGELELVLAETGAADPTRGAGMRLYLVTHDVDHYVAALRTRGIEAGEPTAEPWGGRVAELRDPDGYQLCLVQSRPHILFDEP